MCTRAGNRLAAAFVLLLTAIASTGTPPVYADPITFSGSVAYDGLYSGDTLYVAVLDTVGVEDVTLLDVQAIAVSPPPFDQAYMLNFDNTGVAATVLIASFLDVDGGVWTTSAARTCSAGTPGPRRRRPCHPPPHNRDSTSRCLRPRSRAT